MPLTDDARSERLCWYSEERGRVYSIFDREVHTKDVVTVAEWSRYRVVAGLVMSSSPSTTKSPSCRGAMHVKSVKSSNVLPLAE
ncbi:hypothetical protein TNCV_4631471 [Trichonephila clavipes]|nr:hypothetical protein TNCV_4631471 [Trichonephila clavipes]